MIGVKPLSQSAIDAGEQITITEGGKTLNFTTREGETVEQTLNRLGDAIKGSGLALDLLRPDPTTMDGKLPQAVHLRHKQFGSEHSFTVASTTGGVLSAKGDISEMVQNGTDVEGEINGESAFGHGRPWCRERRRLATSLLRRAGSGRGLCGDGDGQPELTALSDWCERRADDFDLVAQYPFVGLGQGRLKRVRIPVAQGH